MKFVDYLIIAAVVVGFYLAYAGYRWSAVFMLTSIFTLASYRFWDQKRANAAARGSGGDNLPDVSDRTGGMDGDSGDSGGGDGGGD
ncbi:MAG: hypothetical protein RL514_3313 [Verrucomicrobiota bacterium]|jgi:uncharacterized membrane protein YgcG